jgi:hypothetical protein
MKLFVTIFIVTCLTISCNFQFLKGNKDNVYWDKNRPLKWSDFKGKVPQKKTVGVASMCYNISFFILPNNSIQVKNCFIKSKSWVKEGFMNEKNLVHEQYHFNLAEVYARKMREEMSKINFPSTKNVQDVFNKYAEEHEIQQSLYDKETFHSQNHNAQIRWQNEIDSLLNDLISYEEEIVYLLKN